jgi:hypothetical protein
LEIFEQISDEISDELFCDASLPNKLLCEVGAGIATKLSAAN